ncbi:hypothetical protein ACGG0V_001983 [Salmonella enterica]|nr:hypothetical protein [Salmonella enterica]EKT1602940.1 hypothetical protein [Salmonella enterica]
MKSKNNDIPQIANVKVPYDHFNIQSLAMESWLSFRKNNSNNDWLVSVDELDSILTDLFYSIHKYGFNSIGTLDTIRTLLDKVYSEKKDVISFFNLILRITKDELNMRINEMFNNMSSYLKAKLKDESLIVPSMLISSIRDFLNDNKFDFFDEREIKILSGGVCLKDEFISYECEIFSLISDCVIDRVVVSPYTNILIEFFRDNNDMRHDNEELENKVKLSPKKGPRNPELYSYVIGIVDATLRKYPNATTYALTEKLEEHLDKYFHGDPERKKWRISNPQLRRWIKEHREMTGQEPQGKHDGYLKLEL